MRLGDAAGAKKSIEPRANKKSERRAWRCPENPDVWQPYLFHVLGSAGSHFAEFVSAFVDRATSTRVCQLDVASERTGRISFLGNVTPQEPPGPLCRPGQGHSIARLHLRFSIMETRRVDAPGWLSRPSRCVLLLSRVRSLSTLEASLSCDFILGVATLRRH